MDVFSAEKRSAVMSAIRAENTKPEMALRQALHRLGYRYVLHDSRLPGKPDLVFPRSKVALQVRGCFWHLHSCLDGHLPRSHAKYWRPKLHKNAQRDRRNDRKLREMGWHLIVVWECQCRNSLLLARQVDRIVRLLNDRKPLFRDGR